MRGVDRPFRIQPHQQLLKEKSSVRGEIRDGVSSISSTHVVVGLNPYAPLPTQIEASNRSNRLELVPLCR